MLQTHTGALTKGAQQTAEDLTKKELQEAERNERAAKAEPRAATTEAAMARAETGLPREALNEMDHTPLS